MNSEQAKRPLASSSQGGSSDPPCSVFMGQILNNRRFDNTMM
jgi:hypothetical protein